MLPSHFTPLNGYIESLIQWVNDSILLHSEHAETVAAFDAVVERGAECDADRGARVARIDNADGKQGRRGEWDDLSTRRS